MALPVRPLTEGFALPYAFDPALDVGDGTPAATEKYLNEYRRCVEHVDFASLVRPGDAPTMFHFRPLQVSEFRKIARISQSQGEQAYFAFRLCLESVENGGPALAKLERAVDPAAVELGKILNLKFTDMIDRIPVALGRPPGELITDLGLAVLGRCGDTRPT